MLGMQMHMLQFPYQNFYDGENNSIKTASSVVLMFHSESLFGALLFSPSIFWGKDAYLNIATQTAIRPTLLYTQPKKYLFK